MNSVRVCYNNSNSFFIRNRRQNDVFYIFMKRTNMVCTNYNSYITQKAPKDLQLLNRRTRSGKFIEEELLYAVDPMDPHMGWTTS